MKDMSDPIHDARVQRWSDAMQAMWDARADWEQLVCLPQRLALSMSEEERTNLVWALLRSLPMEDAAKVAGEALLHSPVQPVAADKASLVTLSREWASAARPIELNAWAAAIYRQMDDEARSKLWAWAEKQARIEPDAVLEDVDA